MKTPLGDGFGEMVSQLPGGFRDTRAQDRYLLSNVKIWDWLGKQGGYYATGWFTDEEDLADFAMMSGLGATPVEAMEAMLDEFTKRVGRKISAGPGTGAGSVP